MGIPLSEDETNRTKATPAELAAMSPEDRELEEELGAMFDEIDAADDAGTLVAPTADEITTYPGFSGGGRGNMPRDVGSP